MFKYYTIDPEKIRYYAEKIHRLADDYHCTHQEKSNQILEVLNGDLSEIMEGLDKLSGIDAFKDLSKQYGVVVQENMAVIDTIGNSVVRLIETMDLTVDCLYQFSNKLEEVNEILGLCQITPESENIL